MQNAIMVITSRWRRGVPAFGWRQLVPADCCTHTCSARLHAWDRLAV